jgi:hypothetical protein
MSIARLSSARGIAIDRNGVARPGPRRCVTVDTGSGGRAARFNVHRFTAPRRLSLPFTSITLILITLPYHIVHPSQLRISGPPQGCPAPRPLHPAHGRSPRREFHQCLTTLPSYRSSTPAAGPWTELPYRDQIRETTLYRIE